MKHTTNKSVICNTCRQRWTVDFSKSETQKQVICPNVLCGKVQIVKLKK